MCFLNIFVLLGTHGRHGGGRVKAGGHHYRINHHTVSDAVQGRNAVRWRPGQRTNSAPPWSKFGAPVSNLSSFEGKFTVLKKVLATLLGLFGAPAVNWRPGNCAPLVTPLMLCLAAFNYIMLWCLLTICVSIVCGKLQLLVWGNALAMSSTSIWFCSITRVIEPELKIWVSNFRFQLGASKLLGSWSDFGSNL